MAGQSSALHRRQCLLELGEKGIPHRGVADAIMQPCGCIKMNAQLLACCNGECKVGVGPFCVFSDKLDVGVARFGHITMRWSKGGPTRPSIT